MNLSNMFQMAVARYPEAEAIVDGDRYFTYLTWNERIARLAGGLRDLGVEKGDRVAVVLPNREEAATTYWALQKLGAVATPVNFRWEVEELTYCVKDAGARAIVYDEESRGKAAQAAERVPHLLQIYVGQHVPAGAIAFEALITRSEPLAVPVDVSERDYHVLLYTSGTSGRPKGVARTHKNDYAGTLAHAIALRWTPHERTLGVMPFYHIMGIRCLLGIAFLNGAIICQPRFSPHRSLELIQRERVTSLYLVPTIFHDIVRFLNLSQYDLSSVRRLCYAGASMTQVLVQECADLFAPEIFVNHYGSTEANMMSTYDRLHEKPGCAGRAGLHTRIRVVRADPAPSVAPDEVLRAGETGEVIVDAESDEVFGGYWNRPDATQRALRDGWYYTGDLGYLDEDGDLFVVGRVDDMIISGGENIQPLEIEEVLAGHPKVREVAVAGLPDERWGQIVAAFVVPAADGVTAEELDGYCLDDPGLSDFKRPRRYEFIKAIPKSPVGKILRRRLVAGEYERHGVAAGLAGKEEA